MTAAYPLVEGADPTRSVVRRLVAWVVDQVLLTAVSAFAIWVTPVTFVSHTPAPGVTYYEPEGSAAAVVLVYLIPVAFWFANTALLQGTQGFTIGKFFLSLRTVRFDGRPPGVWRAFVRSAILAVGVGLGGCFYLAFALLMIVFTKGHRRLGDILAGTFVVDAIFAGHLIRLTSEGVSAGPRSVYASEVSRVAAGSDGDRAAIEAKLRPDEPVYDKRRDTYVAWNSKEGRLLEFDKAARTWKPTT